MTTENKNQQMEIANTIIRQMGGAGRLGAMIGAKNFLALNSGVRFDFKMNTKMNRCEIELNSMDLYDVKFYKNCKITGNEKTIKAMDKKIAKSQKVVEASEGIYNEMLKPIFESTTGL